MKKLTLFVLVCVLSIGCMPSLHPLYNEEDIIFKPELLGIWSEKKNNISYEFSSNNGHNYVMTYTEDSTSSNFVVNLVQLGDNLFMDICPEKPDCGNDFYNDYLLPVHSFYKVTLADDKLRLDGLDGDWVESEIKKGKLALAHEFVDDDSILLTATTADLKKFVYKYSNNESAFPKGDEAFRQN